MAFSAIHINMPQCRFCGGNKETNHHPIAESIGGRDVLPACRICHAIINNIERVALHEVKESNQRYIQPITIGTCSGILQAGTAIVGADIPFSYSYEMIYSLNAHQKDIWDKREYPFKIEHLSGSQARFRGSANANFYYSVWGGTNDFS